MKLLSGVVLLVGAEQAYGHALLVQFPNQNSASSILIPGSLVFLVLGSILMLWGLLTECRSSERRTSVQNISDAGNSQ